jgi:hypothetical protein
MKVGDPITIVVLPGGLLFSKQVTRVDPDGDFVADHTLNMGRFARIFNAEPGGNESASEEGVRWIRGHHERDSAEGQALLAAAMLVASEPEPLPHVDELTWLEKQ